MKHLKAEEQKEERKSFEKLGFKRNKRKVIRAPGDTNIEFFGIRFIAKIIYKLNWI